MMRGWVTTVWEPKQTMREEEIVYIYFVFSCTGTWRDWRDDWCGLNEEFFAIRMSEEGVGVEAYFLEGHWKMGIYSWTCGLRWDWKRYYGQYFTHRYVWQRWCFGRNSIDIWRYVWDDCSLMEYFKGSILQQLSRGRRGSISSFYWIAAWTCNARRGHTFIFFEKENTKPHVVNFLGDLTMCKNFTSLDGSFSFLDDLETLEKAVILLAYISHKELFANF